MLVAEVDLGGAETLEFRLFPFLLLFVIVLVVVVGGGGLRSLSSSQGVSTLVSLSTVL